MQSTDHPPSHWARRLGFVRVFARHWSATDPRTEIPPAGLLPFRARRARPYLYTEQEIQRLLAAAKSLSPANRLRPWTYHCLFGLLAVSGLRISEAIKLERQDVDFYQGVLTIRQTKFNKSRLVPMHASVVAALDAYLCVRAKVAGVDDHVFLRVGGRPMGLGALHAAFHVILNKANIAPDRPRRPRIHDLRHTFATRALTQCAMRREDVARDFVALSTYLGHSEIRHTYWYLEATPDLMGDIAAAAEILAAEVVA